MGFEQEAFETIMGNANGNMSVWDEMRRAGKGEPFVLRHLAKHGSSTPSQLAAALRVSSGRISTVLGSLEKKGYVTRAIDPDDRRGIRVTLTAAGEEQINRYRDEMRERICWVFSQMGERRTRELVELADEFTAYLSMCRPGEPLPTPEQVRAAFAERESRREAARSGMRGA